MKKLNLNLEAQLLSESARRKITVEPDWWKKLGENSRKAYLKKHPNSQMAKFIKKKQAEQRKRKQKAKQAEKPVESIKPQRTFTDRNASNDSVIETIEKKEPTFTSKVVSRVKDFINNRKKRVSDYNQAQLKAVGEKLTRQEIKRRAAEKLPAVKNVMKENKEKFMGSVKSVSNYISQALSPSKKEGLGSWLKARLEGKTTDGSGEDTGKLVAIHVITAALGLGALVAVTAGVAPIAGALAGAFFGFNDYRRSLPKKVAEETAKKRKSKKPVEDLEEESAAELMKETETSNSDTVNQDQKPAEPAAQDTDEDIDPEEVQNALKQADAIINSANEPEIESKSSDAEEIDQDPVRYLTEEIGLWLRDQDQDLIAEKIAELVAIEEMVKEGWKPNISDLSDEELDELINADKKVLDKTLTSESADDQDYELEFVEEEQTDEEVVKKLTLRCSKECARLPNNERWRYNIRYGNAIIGNIRCVVKNTGGKYSRNWICVLEDGFNESVYRSGKPARNDAPYTLLKKGKIYLINPIKQTFDETWAWAKLNIDKDYL